MRRLISFELQKIWLKRSFLFSICALMTINFFFMWYTNLEGEGRPELYSYKRFQSDIAKMSEAEKSEYILKLKQNIDGVSFAANIIAMQNSEAGAAFAEQEMNEHPGELEAYYGLYDSGEYLKYTDSLETESTLINELYEEYNKAASYGTYLKGIQETGNILGDISVLGSENENSFTSRNVRKSAADYAGLTTEGICWTPSKAIVSAIESTWTDIFLILLTFLFIGSLITEEKQKGLFYITRSTKYGISQSIISKLSALLIHCIVSSIVFYFSNYLFFGFAAGFCDLSVKLQSLAPYMESNLSISILEHLIISVFTKAIVLFGTGAILAAVCIISESVVMPYLAGIGFWTISWALYRLISPVSKCSMLKHINLFGILRTENLYGSYLNLDFGGYPVSRVTLSWIVIAIVVWSGIIISYALFLKGGKLQIKHGTKRFSFHFHPHAGMLKHEGYKILITNHAFVILLVFCGLIGYVELGHNYAPSVMEQYYRDIMLQLEGEQTNEKVSLIESEITRYQEAYDEIERIDAAISSGELDEKTGEAMKIKWNGITAFYPAFQRVEEQYQLVRKNGGSFIYDTGYLYLMGIMGDGVLNEFLLLTIGIVIAFSNVISMEYQNGTWGIICATKKGRQGIIKDKIIVSVLAASLFAALPFICRFISVSAAFPIHGLLYAARNIPLYQAWAPHIPAISLLMLKLILQMLTGAVVTMVMLVLSAWRKSHVQAVFFGILVICIPVILAVLGFGFAKCFSLYPLYSYGFFI